MNVKSFIAFTLVFVLAVGQAWSQRPENILAAVGTPHNPKVPITFNRYNDNTALAELYQKLQTAHPDLVQVSSIGKSFEGRDIWVVTVSDRTVGDPDRKPAMYIDGGIHANEIQTSEFCLYTIWYLAEMHAAGNKFVRQLLAEKTFYIAPSINPDARDHFIHNANTQHSSRSGMIPIDNDRDGQYNEDDFDDLDGDGHIVMMRRKSPYGQFVPDTKDPRRMVRVAEGQQGEYELLGFEGIDNDGDGLINEDGQGAYDPNRDWGWNWQPNYVQRGAYKYPFSLPENRAVADFIMSKPNIAAGQNYHNMGGMILRGPGAQEDESTYSRQDVMVYDELGRRGEQIIPGYNYLVVYKDLYSVFGGQLDWMYAARGIFVFCNELWTSYLMYNQREADDRQAEQYSFDQYLLMGDGFVDWKPFNHPHYGEIEIGGFKKTYGRLHPGFLLESDAHRNMAFTLFHAYNTPQLEVAEIDVKELGGGLKEVTAVVTNSRLIPTHASVDIQNKIEVPNIISLDGGKVLSGMVVDNRDLGLTTEQRNDPANIRVTNIPGNSHVTVRWLVRGGSSFTVTVDSKKGGVASKST